MQTEQQPLRALSGLVFQCPPLDTPSFKFEKGFRETPSLMIGITLVFLHVGPQYGNTTIRRHKKASVFNIEKRSQNVKIQSRHPSRETRKPAKRREKARLPNASFGIFFVGNMVATQSCLRVRCDPSSGLSSYLLLASNSQR